MGIPVVVTHALDGQQVEFTLDFSEGSLAETLAAIHAELEEGEAVRPVGEYVLISPSRGAYLTAETWLAGGARWLEAGAELQLALAPAVEVRDQLQQLRSPEVERDAKKKLVFNLKKRLTAPEFSEEFIAQDGLAALLQLVNDEDAVAEHGSALQGYTLLALRQVLCWQSAMEQLCDSEGLMGSLFRLTYSRHLKSISRALELLFVFCYFDDSRHSFTRVLSAASATARAHDEPPFAVLVRHLSSGDLDVKLNALTLINSLISCAPGRHERERLIFQLDRLRVNESLLESVDSRDDLWRTQLDVYTGLTQHIDLPGSWYEADFYSGKAHALALELEDARRSLDLFRLEQPLVALLQEEVLRAHRLVGRARKRGVLLGRGVTQRGDDHEEGPLQLNLLARAGTLASVEAADPVALWELMASNIRQQLIEQRGRHANMEAHARHFRSRLEANGGLLDLPAPAEFYGTCGTARGAAVAAGVEAWGIVPVGAAAATAAAAAALVVAARVAQPGRRGRPWPHGQLGRGWRLARASRLSAPPLPPPSLGGLLAPSTSRRSRMAAAAARRPRRWPPAPPGAQPPPLAPPPWVRRRHHHRLAAPRRRHRRRPRRRAPPPPPPPGAPRPGAEAPRGRRSPSAGGARRKDAIVHWSRLVLDGEDERDRRSLWWDLAEVAFDAQFERGLPAAARGEGGGHRGKPEAESGADEGARCEALECGGHLDLHIAAPRRDSVGGADTRRGEARSRAGGPNLDAVGHSR